MKISNFSTIIATFSISAILYCLKGWLKKMGIIIPNWIIGMIGFSGLAYVVIKDIVPPAYQAMIEPYTAHILSIEITLIVLSLIFRRYQWLQKEKDVLQKVSQGLSRSDKETMLKDIWAGKTDNECALWDYGKYGYSAVPLNDTWQQWISSGNGKYGLVVTVNRPDLDYYNFGNEFYFVDLKTNKKISIPTGNRARNEQVGNLFHNGMVVRLMPRTI